MFSLRKAREVEAVNNVYWSGVGPCDGLMQRIEGDKAIHYLLNVPTLSINVECESNLYGCWSPWRG